MKKIKELDLEIIKTSNIVFLVGLLIILLLCFIFKWPFTFGISFILGYLANILGFLKNNHLIDEVLNGERPNTKKAMLFNTVTSYIIYGVVLVINLLVPIFNIFACFFGLLIIKIVIVFKYGFNR